MQNLPYYRNTDLELVSARNLDHLAESLVSQGHFKLHLEQHDDSLWHGNFETGKSFLKPEANIIAFLSAIESLDAAAKKAWTGCRKRVFNVGVECSGTLTGFHLEIMANTLARLASHRVSLVITAYCHRAIAAADARSAAKRRSHKM